jgi:hypothetical protein
VFFQASTVCSKEPRQRYKKFLIDEEEHKTGVAPTSIAVWWIHQRLPLDFSGLLPIAFRLPFGLVKVKSNIINGFPLGGNGPRQNGITQSFCALAS